MWAMSTSELYKGCTVADSINSKCVFPVCSDLMVSYSKTFNKLPEGDL